MSCVESCLSQRSMAGAATASLASPPAQSKEELKGPRLLGNITPQDSTGPGRCLGRDRLRVHTRRGRDYLTGPRSASNSASPRDVTRFSSFE